MFTIHETSKTVGLLLLYIDAIFAICATSSAGLPHPAILVSRRKLKIPEINFRKELLINLLHENGISFANHIYPFFNLILTEDSRIYFNHIFNKIRKTTTIDENASKIIGLCLCWLEFFKHSYYLDNSAERGIFTGTHKALSSNADTNIYGLLLKCNVKVKHSSASSG